MFKPNTTTIKKVCIASSERKKPPISFLLSGENCQSLAFLCPFSYLFSTAEFEFRIERDVKLIPVKYFNQRLPKFTERFASYVDNIFYALSVSQKDN